MRNAEKGRVERKGRTEKVRRRRRKQKGGKRKGRRAKLTYVLHVLI